MSIQSELTRLTDAKAAIKTAIENQGIIIPNETLLDGMASLIEHISTLIINRSITKISNNNVTTIGISAFSNCSSLTTVDLPAVTTIGNSAFYSCSSLTTVDLPAVTTIDSYAFDNCSSLMALILRSETKAVLQNMNAFYSTPIYSGTGYIYVPSALIDSYKTATNWTKYANQFRAIEDYPDICGGAE